jgi:putative ATP-dependent endonuclease of OLD family
LYYNINLVGVKLLSFEIKNYKCIESVVAPKCSNLTTFIGRNSAGKTSIFDALKYIRQIHQSFNDGTLREIVHGGVKKYDDKYIFVNYLFEISENLRKEYVMHFLDVTEDAYTTFVGTDLFKKVQISIKTRVEGTETTQLNYDNVFVLDSLSISNTKGELIPLLVLYLQNSSLMQVSEFDFIQNPKPRILTSDSIDKQLQSALVKKSGFEYSGFLKNLSLQSKIIRNIINNIKFIGAIRESTKRIGMEFKEDAGERGSNLIGLMDTLFRKDHKRFLHIVDICKKIFPDIIDIHPDPLPCNQVRIVVKKILLQNEIDLAQEGSGIDQLFIMIWSIAIAEKGTIWFLDEPELHLHPGAQKSLYDFFREESENGKQLFVATHSMVFIYNSKPEEIYLLVDKEGKAQLIRISDLIPPEEIGSPEGVNKIRNEVYKVLGYEPVFSFEPKTVVFVEGSADKGIIKAFTKKLLNNEIDENSTRFVITGSSSALESFGPLLVYSMMGKKAILIRDNDTNNPVELKEKMLRLEKQYRIQARIDTPILSDDNFYFYPDKVSSIEYYLLDAKAIVESYNLLELEREAKIKEISDEIEKAKRISRQGKFRAKTFLDSLCKRHFDSYQEVDNAIAIAEKLPKDVIETYPELITLINKIVY